ncbi:lipase secretion chaperone [Noviherbaspirillum sp.]|uniref:lipase secretion chaperone n=1 Tax=Noviherbaspirillum sp. TaxID=1926288 RepID=UPI002FE06FE4
MTTWIPKFAAAAIVGALAYLMYPSDDLPRSADRGSAAHVPGVDNLGSIFAAPAASRHPAASVPATLPQAALFDVDGKGELLLDASVLPKLDILLGSLPTNPGRTDLQRVEEAAQTGLPATAQTKALRILHGYIAYRKAEEEIGAAQADAASDPMKYAMKPEQALEQVIALRRQHLGKEVADALFAVQEAQAKFDLEIAMIEADPTLAGRDKATRIAALRKAAAPEIAYHGADPPQGESVEEKVALLRQGGAAESDVQRLRRQYFGEEGAREVGEMENQKNEWERRYQAFAQQKTALLASASSERQKQQGVEALLRQHYTEEEIETARAYDQGNSRINGTR